MSSPQWFCLVVSPGRVRQIESELQARGYRSFQPRTKRWVNHARVKTAKEKPAFGLGRYLFVEVDHPRQSFSPVTAVDGVQYLISAGNVPWPMPRSEVEDLLLRFMRGEFDETKGSAPIGARVAIMAGKFENWIGTVTAQKGKRVNVKLLGRNAHANDVSLVNLRPAFGFDLQRENPELEPAQ